MGRLAGQSSVLRKNNRKSFRRRWTRINSDIQRIVRPPQPTCWSVFLSPKIASDPRHYWRKSCWGGELAGQPTAIAGAKARYILTPYGPTKSRALIHVFTPKDLRRKWTRINADFLEWIVALTHPTCWQVFLSLKSASDPRRYWRKSIRAGALAAGQSPVVSPQNPASLMNFQRPNGREPRTLECC